MLKVCLVFDCEGFISFKQGNPRWGIIGRIKGKINNFIKKYRYNMRGFEIVYNTLLKEKFPATLMLVGSLFKPIEKHEFIEYGYHTYNHTPLTLASDEKVKEEIKNIYNVKSFSPPLWMVEDAKDPDRIFGLLEKENYKYVIYRGKDYGIKHEHHFEISKPKKRGNLYLIHVSNWVEGNSKISHIKKVLKEIEINSNRDAVYLITSHDFTRRTNKNLLFLIRELRKLEKNKKINIMKIGELK